MDGCGGSGGKTNIFVLKNRPLLRLATIYNAVACPEKLGGGGGGRELKVISKHVITKTYLI